MPKFRRNKQQKRHVLIVIGTLDVGGAERHILRVMPELNTSELEVTVYTTNHPGFLAEELQAKGVRVISPPFCHALKKLGRLGKPMVYFLSVVKLSAYIIRYRPDVAHFYLPGAYILGGFAAVLTRCKRLVMSRRIIYNREDRSRFLFRLEKLMHHRIDFALACSTAIKDDLAKEGIPHDKIGVIYNGINVNQFAGEVDQSKARVELQIDPTVLVISIVANLYQRKGHIDLLNALALIKCDLPANWLLLAVGRDGGERAFLEEKTNALGLSDHIHWLGQRMDVSTILAAADFGVLCSHEEGFSNALLESMVMGLPMVVTDVSGSNEAVIDGDNGLVVPVSSPETLSRAILSLARNKALRCQMSSRARQRVQDNYSLDKVILDYKHFYQALFNDAPLQAFPPRAS